MKFVGFISQPCPQPKICNGTNMDGSTESELTLSRRNREERRHNSDENVKTCNEGTFSGQSSESGIEEEIRPESGQSQDTDFQDGREGSPRPTKLKRGGGTYKHCLHTLLALNIHMKNVLFLASHSFERGATI